MRRTEWLTRALVAAAVGAVVPTLVPAQTPGPAPPVNIDPRRATREQQAREAGLRSGEIVLHARPDTTEAKAQMEQVRKDFARLQELRNEIAKPLVAHERVDYKRVAERANEVNKRANRLKTLLVVVESDAEAKAAAAPPPLVDAGHMDESLVILCKTIDRFVESPVFAVSGVVDVKQSTVAGVELQRIIDLSDGIRRGAEQVRSNR